MAISFTSLLVKTLAAEEEGVHTLVGQQYQSAHLVQLGFGSYSVLLNLLDTSFTVDDDSADTVSARF